MINCQSPASFGALKFNSLTAAESKWLSDKGGKGIVFADRAILCTLLCYSQGNTRGKKGFKTRKKMCIWISATCHQLQTVATTWNYHQLGQYQVSYSAILHLHKSLEKIYLQVVVFFFHRNVRNNEDINYIHPCFHLMSQWNQAVQFSSHFFRADLWSLFRFPEPSSDCSKNHVRLLSPTNYVGNSTLLSLYHRFLGGHNSHPIDYNPTFGSQASQWP